MKDSRKGCVTLSFFYMLLEFNCFSSFDSRGRIVNEIHNLQMLCCPCDVFSHERSVFLRDLVKHVAVSERRGKRGGQTLKDSYGIAAAATRRVGGPASVSANI